MNELGSEYFRFFRFKKYFKAKQVMKFENCYGSDFFDKNEKEEQVAENMGCSEWF